MYLEECDVEEQCSLLGWAALQKTKLGWMQIFGVVQGLVCVRTLHGHEVGV